MSKPEMECPERERVLVVEDYDDIRDMITKILEKAGFVVVPCENGTDALHKFLDSFRCAKNAGILMDLSLPDINGLRVMSAIREIEKGSPIDCVPIRMGVITAQGHVVEGTEVYDRLGVTLRVDKPFLPSSLVERIEGWLRLPPPELYHLSSVRAGA